MENNKIPKGYYKITPTQLSAIANAADTLSGVQGCGNEDFYEEAFLVVKNIDRFLKVNGMKRKFK